MKTLPLIQTLCKAGKIVSKVLRICCIVGFCLCLTGIVSLALGGEAFKLGGVTIHSMIQKDNNTSLPSIYATMAVGLVFCAAEAVICRYAETYFKNELADGTPFTLRGSKELMRLGVIAAAVSLGAVIVCSIGLSVADHFYPGVDKSSLDGFSAAGVGVTMILLSLILRCGAEQIEEAKGEAPSDGEPEEDREQP